MNYIKPKNLTKGDTIAFIAPAGSVKDPSAIERAKVFFESLGYNVVFSKHLFNSLNYLSDIDENRLYDLHWAFKSKDIDAIICARGGYGCLRLIDMIDYDLVRSNPKIFCGYSDITVLSAMFLKRAGLITYSGPMARSDFGAEEKSEYTISGFFNAFEDVCLSYKADKIYKSGDAKGVMFGGNLSSIVSLCGIDFLPDEDFIFFAEDLNEPMYKIDKMFTQLFNIDKFRSNVKGLILGDFLDNGYPEQLENFFFGISNKYNIPTLGGFNITHNKDKITVPYGQNVLIKSDTISFI